MRIPIFSTRACRKFVVKSYEVHVWLMVMKFQNFHENHEFWWNSASRKFLKSSDFQGVWGPKISRGLALRAMFKISATSRIAVMRDDFHCDFCEGCETLQHDFWMDMACRAGFVSNCAANKKYFLPVATNLGEIRRDVFGSKISCFWCVRECLLIVFNFLLSNSSFDHEDSDSEHERFQKILSQKFELDSGLPHGAKIRKFPKFRHVVRVWGVNFATGPALRAMFKIIWLVETVL